MHSIATDSKGNIFTTETYRQQRVQLPEPWQQVTRMIESEPQLRAQARRLPRNRCEKRCLSTCITVDGVPCSSSRSTGERVRALLRPRAIQRGIPHCIARDSVFIALLFGFCFTLSFRQSEAGYGLYLEPAEYNEESLILLWELEPARCSTLRLREGFAGACPGFHRAQGGSAGVAHFCAFRKSGAFSERYNSIDRVAAPLSPEGFEGACPGFHRAAGLCGLRAFAFICSRVRTAAPAIADNSCT